MNQTPAHAIIWALFLLQLFVVVKCANNITPNVHEGDYFIAPIGAARVKEFGFITITPTVVQLNSSATTTITYKSSTLPTGFVFDANSGTYSYCPNVGMAGKTLTLQRNATFYDSSTQSMKVQSEWIDIIIEGNTAVVNSLPLLRQDNFTNLATGMKWTTFQGTSYFSQQTLVINKNNTIVLSGEAIESNDVTYEIVSFTSFQSNRGFILNWIDSNNYYEIQQLYLYPGTFYLTRVLNGVRTLLLSSTFLVGGSGLAVYSNHKFYIKKESNSITISVGKLDVASGEYLINVVDSDPDAMKVFYSNNGKIGFYDKTTDQPTQDRYRIVSVKVWKGKLLHAQGIPQTFYVDQSTGSDSNSGSKASPWKTLTRAQYMLMPGDSLIIGPGVYRESLKMLSSALPGHPITFTGTDAKKVIIDGSLPVDMKKVSLFTTSPVNIYTTTIQRNPKSIYLDDTLLVPAMIPLPYTELDPFTTTNYLTITDANTVTKTSNMVYLKLHDIFRKNVDGTSVPNGYWVGAVLYHFIGDGNNPTGAPKVTYYRPVLTYDNETNTAGFSTTVIVPVDYTTSSPFSFIKNDKYALANHVGLISKPGQFVFDDNQLYVSSNTPPKSIEISVLRNGIFLQQVENFKYDSLTIRRFEHTGVYCNYCHKSSFINITSNYNSYDGIGVQMGDNIIINVKNFVACSAKIM